MEMRKPISARKSSTAARDRNTRYERRDHCHVGHTPLAMSEYIARDRLSSKCTESGRYMILKAAVMVEGP